nr:GNAT family N-acetyltransferase [Neobacillus sp. Marseille-Q6967]
MVEVLGKGRVEDFLVYCRRHRSEVDDSFLYEEDLRTFEPNAENPTYIVTNGSGDIVGAASLIIDEYHQRGNRARFRIFHSELNDVQTYRLLLQSILKHTVGLEKVFQFIPVVNKELIGFIEELKFSLERYTFLLVREDPEIPSYHLPDGYEIKAFHPGKDEEIWCQVRNAGFAKLLGNETPITPEMAAKMTKETDYLEGGMMILYHHNHPVGVIRGADDEYENRPIMNIGPIAVIPEYQGKGLGRSLIRASLKYAKEKGYDRTVLCVNGENERAKALYLQEGFKQVEAVACYQYFLS